jgi:hypothetical protein
LNDEEFAIEARRARGLVGEVGRRREFADAGGRILEAGEGEGLAGVAVCVGLAPPSGFAGEAEGVGRAVEAAHVVHQRGRHAGGGGEGAGGGEGGADEGEEGLV